MNCLQLLFEKILWYNIPFARIVKPFFLRKALFHPSCVFPYATGVWRLIGYPNDLLFVKNGTLWFDMECLLRILRHIESGS